MTMDGSHLPGTSTHPRSTLCSIEAVNLTGLDHQDFSRTGLELLAIHHVAAAAFSNELDLVPGTR
jgi:hypothetical protein